MSGSGKGSNDKRRHSKAVPYKHSKSRKPSVVPVKAQSVLDETFGLVNRTSGSAHVAQTWRHILEEDTNYFEDINKMLRDPSNFQKELRQTTTAPIKFEDEGEKLQYYTVYNGIASHSGSSIDTRAIRSASQEKKYTARASDRTVVEPELSKKRRDSPNAARKLFNACCDPPLLGKPKKAYKVLEKCTKRIGQYYHKLNTYFEQMETQLKFPTSAKISPNINLISAQLWFVTFALTRRIDIRPITSTDTAFFRHKYHRILAFGVRMQEVVDLLELCISELFEGEGLSLVKDGKRLLTGSSMTDLMKDCQTSPDDDFFVPGDSWTRLTRQGMSQSNWLKHKLNGSLESSSAFDQTDQQEEAEMSHASHAIRFSGLQDTLSERRNLDIFVRNVSKSGWMNYENNFPLEQRVRLLRELLVQTMGKTARLMTTFWGLKNKLNSADSGCFTGSLMPWLRKIPKCIEAIHTSPEFCAGDYERIRFQLFAIEVYLKALIERGKEMKNHLESIVAVSIVCSTLLENKYHLFLPNFKGLSEKVAVTKQGRRLSTGAAAKQDDEFFLSEYSQTLKEIPIYFGVSQFILTKRIEPQERHSGADFDGLRFF